MKPQLLVFLAASALTLTSCYIRLGSDGWDGDFSQLEARSATPIERFRDANRANLAKLAVGMTIQEVQEIMGTKSLNPGNGIGMIHNPYRTASYTDREGRPVLVFHYYTSLQRRDNVIKDDELTPVGFRDGQLIGWGPEFFASEIGPGR